MPAKPVIAEPLVVVGEREDLVEESGVSRREKSGMSRREKRGMSSREKVPPRKYWVREGANEEPRMEGWGMV